MKHKNNHSLTGRTQAKQAAKGTGKRLFAALLMLCLVLTMPCTSTLAENGLPKSIQTETVLPDADNAAANSVMHENGTNTQKEKDSTSGNTVTDGNGNTETDPETTATPANPIHHHTGKDDGTDTTIWSYVYFGAYPQSEVTDAATKTAIDAAIASGNGTAAGTAESSEGIDVWLGGTRYRRISKSDCNYTGYFGDVKNNGYRYFKWERIKWRVLKNDGSTLFVAADRAVDSKYYNDTGTDVTWENCTLHGWLNGTFYRNAFSSAEQGAIVAQNVVNEDNPDSNTEGGNDTVDNVYLLSIGEMMDGNYGFCSDYSIGSDSRRLKTSDYANARGARRETYTGCEGNCWWWLRSSGNHSYYAAGVTTLGDVNMTGIPVNNHGDGVVPVLHINLTSDLWDVADDGTSGGGGGTDDSGKTDSGTGNTGNTQKNKIKVSQISLTGISKKIAAGKKIKLTAEVLPGDATDKTLTWTSSNSGYATVDAQGNVTTKKAGAGKSVTITAAAKDGSGVQAKYQIKLMKHAVKKVKITASSKTVKAEKKLKLKATVTTTGKNANKKLKWTSSNESYATVSSSGVVKAKKAGKGKTVTITATATDGTGKKAKIKVKIQ